MLFRCMMWHQDTARRRRKLEDAIYIAEPGDLLPSRDEPLTDREEDAPSDRREDVGAPT